ncbi:MAG: di-trans,poly-cis-decaprenylcistransferase [Planctomycetaceae bacterium]|nr:di-trans,poly-cis-decaprenylcistransferase [Planctomycetaceae bacterium]
MDGNGRWAVSRGEPRIEGHREGAKTARMVIEESARLELEQVTLFCLSSENWKRPADELQMLLRLLEEYLIRERDEVVRRNLRFSMIGRREGLPEGVLRELDATADAAKGNTGTYLCLAINYGSRGEIVDAARRLASDVAASRIIADEIDETAFAARLDTAGMPDPDLVIRTAGEMRVSNFLLWQISYAELHVSPKCWPEFGRDDYFAALREFGARDRRFGGIKS